MEFLKSFSPLPIFSDDANLIVAKLARGNLPNEMPCLFVNHHPRWCRFQEKAEWVAIPIDCFYHILVPFAADERRRGRDDLRRTIADIDRFRTNRLSYRQVIPRGHFYLKRVFRLKSCGIQRLLRPLFHDFVVAPPTKVELYLVLICIDGLHLHKDRSMRVSRPLDGEMRDDRGTIADHHGASLVTSSLNHAACWHKVDRHTITTL